MGGAAKLHLLMLSGTDVHHAICVTDDEETVAARLRAVLGLPAGAETLSWDAGTPALIGTILGAGSAGTIEVVRLPGRAAGPALAGHDRHQLGRRRPQGARRRLPGGRARRERRPRRRPAGVAYAVVTVAGLEFELVQFDPS